MVCKISIPTKLKKRPTTATTAELYKTTLVGGLILMVHLFSNDFEMVPIETGVPPFKSLYLQPVPY